MPRATPTKSGAQHARDAGLKPIALLVAPEVRDQVRLAAAALGESMAAFAARTVEEAARKTLKDKGLRTGKNSVETS